MRVKPLADQVFYFIKYEAKILLSRLFVLVDYSIILLWCWVDGVEDKLQWIILLLLLIFDVI